MQVPVFSLQVNIGNGRIFEETVLADFDDSNGDADGICALHQLRLATPRAAILVTGVKRDISLLKLVNAVSGDRVGCLAQQKS